MAKGEALRCGQTMKCFSQKVSGDLGAIWDFEITDATLSETTLRG